MVRLAPPQADDTIATIIHYALSFIDDTASDGLTEATVSALVNGDERVTKPTVAVG